MKTQNLLLQLMCWAALVWLPLSCTRSVSQEPECPCCDVPVKTYRLDASRTLLLSQFKESDSYDILSEVAVKIVRSEQPIASGMTIWRNTLPHRMYHPARPDCASMRFDVHDIYYSDYGELIVGYQHSRTALDNGKLDIPAENRTVTIPDTNAFFLRYYNQFVSDSVPLQLSYHNNDSLVKGKYYDDFKYLGTVQYSVASNIGTLTNTYRNVFVAETGDTTPTRAKFIYIDLEYGLVRIVLNNGSVWSVVH